MTPLLCLCLLVVAPPNDELTPDAEVLGDVEEEVEEEVDFEEEADFGDEEPVVRVILPEVDYQPWLLGLPLVLIALLAWNVGWRRRASKIRPPRSAARD
jgi:hypothetical protein